MGEKKKVILVTDGDRIAKRTVETAARNVGARCISCSWGNPTKLTGEQLANQILKAPHNPIVVMFDDRGIQGEGPGESALRYIADHPDIEVLGAVAVASNTDGVEGATVNESITNRGSIVHAPVDKEGYCCGDSCTSLYGDTVEILNELKLPIVVGIGDIGKMNGADDVCYGAPLTTKALQEVLNRSGYIVNNIDTR